MAGNESLEELRAEYSRRKDSIKAQLDEFQKVRTEGDDRRFFEELAVLYPDLGSGTQSRT